MSLHLPFSDISLEICRGTMKFPTRPGILSWVPDPTSYQGYSLPGRPWSNHARSPLMLRTIHLHAEPTPYPVGAGCYRQLTPAVGVWERRELHSHPFNHLDAAVGASKWLITGCRPVAMAVGDLRKTSRSAVIVLLVHPVICRV